MTIKERLSVTTKKIVQLLSLNISIALINLLLFSDGLVGIHFGESSLLMTSIGITSLIMSVIIFFYGNYQLVLDRAKPVALVEIKTKEDFVTALKQCNGKKTFGQEINLFLEQMDRFTHKEDTIHQVLLQKFEQSEMSFVKFESTINDVENVFYMNIRSVLNRLNAFDEADYMYIQSAQAKKALSANVLVTKNSIYQEYIRFVKEAANENENILLKLDQLLFEISKFSSLNIEELENMSAMKDVDELIDKTKYYK